MAAFNSSSTREVKKTTSTWKGPFEIVEAIGESDCRIKAKKGKRTQVVHFDRLKPCAARTRIAQRGGSRATEK